MNTTIFQQVCSKYRLALPATVSDEAIKTMTEVSLERRKRFDSDGSDILDSDIFVTYGNAVHPFHHGNENFISVFTMDLGISWVFDPKTGELVSS